MEHFERYTSLSDERTLSLLCFIRARGGSCTTMELREIVPNYPTLRERLDWMSEDGLIETERIYAPVKKTTVTHLDQNGTTSTQVISQPTYDVFGNVTANNRPGTAADMTYTYDTLHGWVRGISSPSGFSEELLRETATNAQYSGNIGSIQWQNTINGERHRYDYTYDALGRLTSAGYSSSGNGTEGRYDESVSYNPNGSIEQLQRYGMKNNGTFGEIDDLTVSYDGNRLMKVTDAAEALNYNGAQDFNDGANADCEYHYDSNGALTYDSNRGITSITYDYGHHPYKISMKAKKKTHYNCYTSDGRKLLSKHEGMIPTGTGYYRRFSTTDLYIDGLILRDGVPYIWKFDGGYVELDTNGTPTSWNYYVTDHLGSTRKVVDSNNNVKETINYYPFGSEMKMQDPAQMAGDSWQPYRFTSKELDNQNGLNWYDFGARWFDVAGVPMWTSVDPLCEKYYHITPYSYCAGDPINKFDPDGREVRDGVGEYNKENAELKNLTKDLAAHDDPNSIMIVSHGIYNNAKDGFASCIDIQTYNTNQGEWNHNYISNGKQLDNFLSANSQTWKDYKNGKINADDLHIVFYSCGSALVAQEISKDEAFKDVNLIAPNKVVHNLKYKDGSRQTTVENTKFEKTEDGTVQPVGGRRDYGSWVSYKNGSRSSSYRGDKNLRPGTKGFDY